MPRVNMPRLDDIRYELGAFMDNDDIWEKEKTR